jgi:hypothetical protein
MMAGNFSGFDVFTYGLITLEMVFVSVVLFLIYTLIGSFLLWIVILLMKVKKQDYKDALTVAALWFLVPTFSLFIPFLGFTLLIAEVFFLGPFIVRWRYEIGWKRAILVWVIWLLLFVPISVMAFIVFAFGIGPAIAPLFGLQG